MANDLVEMVQAIGNKTSTAFEKMNRRFDSMEAELSRAPAGGGREKKLSELLREHPDFEAFRIKGGRGKISLAFEKSFFPGEMEQKTTITSAAVGSSTTGILVPERMPGIVKPGVQALRVRDLIPRFPTTQNAVDWVKENAYTNAGSPVAETISKAESALTFTIASVPVRTLAHWIPAAKQVLDDLPALRPYVDERLIEGLMDIEDYELVSGDGTGQHLTGLTVAATAYDTARNVSGDTYMDKLNHAISQIEDAKIKADGIILHPRDWRAIQLIKTNTGGVNTGEYLLGGPVGNAPPILWGLPVATTPAVSRGFFMVGSFQRYTAMIDRMQIVIDLSADHADYFVRNLIAIRAEERVALAVTRADALVYGAF